MPPKKPTPRADDLFRSQLDAMIDMEHALVKLSCVRGPARPGSKTR
jgi:IS5 family transposase